MRTGVLELVASCVVFAPKLLLALAIVFYLLDTTFASTFVSNAPAEFILFPVVFRISHSMRPCKRERPR